MEFKNLGKSGLKVSKIILGGMSYGHTKWDDFVLEDEEKVFELLKRAYDVGIRTWDTADMYSYGESERLLGKFLKKYNINRSTVTIITKCYMAIDDDLSLEPTKLNFMNRAGLSRKHILDAVDASIERLGTHIDVFLIHRFDETTPMEETMSALNDVVKQGKVSYVGASSMKAHEFIQMQHVAEINGWTKFICMQNFHNLLYREEEREMIPYCQMTGVGVMPWSPIARGLLTRPLQETSVRGQTDQFLINLDLGGTEANQTIIKRVEELAKKKGVSMAQISIAWSLCKGHTPVIGFNKLERIDEAVSALQIGFTNEELDYLETPYQPRKEEGLRVESMYLVNPYRRE